MLTVTLYQFSKRENSTKRPDSTTVNKQHFAILKMPTSLQRPELTFDFGLKGNPCFYNYAHITDLGNRYYFIRDWVVSDGHLWTAHLEIDVLASWKDVIGASSNYVTRCSKTYDGNIIDNLYPSKGPATLTANSSEIWPVVSSISSGSYVVGIINNSENAIGAVAYYVFSATQFRSFMNFLLGNVDWAGTIDDISQDLLKVLLNPMQYISSVVWYPDSTPGGDSVSEIQFGWWTVNVSAKKLKTSGVAPNATNITIPKHPQATTRGNYLNSAPYSTYIFDSRVWGVIPIDSTSIIDATIVTMEYTIDYTTGISDMYLYSGLSKYALAVRRGMFGVPIQIAQIGQNYLNIAMTAVNGAGSILKNLANPAGLFVGAANAVGDMVNSIVPDFSTSGSNGTVANFTSSPTLYARFLPVVDDDNSDRGRPYCKLVQLSTIPGFQVIAHADIALPSTIAENQAVKNYLESGYFYE